jgi:hypothetical protein
MLKFECVTDVAPADLEAASAAAEKMIESRPQEFSRFIHRIAEDLASIYYEDDDVLNLSIADIRTVVEQAVLSLAAMGWAIGSKGSARCQWFWVESRNVFGAIDLRAFYTKEFGRLIITLAEDPSAQQALPLGPAKAEGGKA